MLTTRRKYRMIGENTEKCSVYSSAVFLVSKDERSILPQVQLNDILTNV